MDYQEAQRYLQKIGQEQLLAFYQQLTEEEKEALLLQIEQTDFSYLDQFSGKDETPKRGVITPIRAMQRTEIEKKRESFRETGLSEIRAGHLGLVLLAGGMGTRLGYSGPKGTFNIGETKDVYIFQRLIENILEIVKLSGTWMHLFIMTSEKNDDATRAFFFQHSFFGYRSDYVHFYCQEMAPVVGGDGKVLLETPCRIAVSPNGNGGWFKSMKRAGYIDLLHQENITWLNVFAVDNVLQKIADPAFLGAVIQNGSVSGSKVVRKANPEEKVGVMCLEDGRPSIVEYIEMTDEMLHQKDEAGQPAYNFGVILNYLFSVRDLERILSESMPVHFAFKKVSCLDRDGNQLHPVEPNAWKFEYFILDMVHELGSCLPYEVDREREFAPIKNLHGPDSVDSARELCHKNGILL